MADPLQALAALGRFLHIGNLLPFYVRKREYISPLMFSELNPLLALIDGKTFATLIKKWTKQKLLPRKDELWFMYASYLIGDASIDEKLKVKEIFPEIAPTPEDLFLFVKYSMIIQNQQEKKSLSKTIRKAIILWYKSKTSEQLIEYLGCNRGLHGFRHKDLIVLCHINLTKLNLQIPALAFFNRCNKFIHLTETEQTEAETSQDSPSMKRMKVMSQLRVCENVEDAKKLIEENQLEFQHIPQTLISNPEIWELILPRLNYEQIIHSCGFAIDSKMFANVAFETAFLTAIGNIEFLKEAKIHPFVFLAEKSKQITPEPVRYSAKIKSLHYRKKVLMHKIKPHKPLNDILEKNFEQSFKFWPGTGLRIFITINLQQNYCKRPVATQKQVNCFAAATTFALAYLKSERFCVVYTFSPETDKLTQIPWNKDFTYKKAEEVCKPLMNKQNCQRTYLPFKEASKKKFAYDLFITIVPSIARGNPMNKPEKLLDHLHEYRAKHNKRAKMVLINLCRFKPGLIHSLDQRDGILEICGIDENTTNLINAFGTANFS